MRKKNDLKKWQVEKYYVKVVNAMHNLDYCNVACSIADKMGTVKSKGHDLSS